ncbi:hypothetical protein ACSLVQ_28380, partial [Klebsiella pneumoniae]
VAARGLTVVLVEQNLDFITQLSDRVLILQKGRIVGEVAAAEMKSAAIIDEFVGFGASRRAAGGGGGARPAVAVPAFAATAAGPVRMRPAP